MQQAKASSPSRPSAGVVPCQLGRPPRQDSGDVRHAGILCPFHIREDEPRIFGETDTGNSEPTIKLLVAAKYLT
jgi:hypothetical protein